MIYISEFNYYPPVKDEQRCIQYIMNAPSKEKRNCTVRKKKCSTLTIYNFPC